MSIEMTELLLAKSRVADELAMWDNATKFVLVVVVAPVIWPWERIRWSHGGKGVTGRWQGKIFY